jgi:hypothetical protein
MINPPQRPEIVQATACQSDLTFFKPIVYSGGNSNCAGRQILAAMYTAGVIRIVEMTSCILRVDSITHGSSTFMKFVAKNEVIKHTIIPNAERTIGKYMAPGDS